MPGLSAGAHVGVVGGGAMGAGIAQVAAFAGHPVVVLEIDPDRAAAAVASVGTAAERRAGKGRLSRGAAQSVRDNVRGSTKVADLVDCALVIEAVVEQLEVKRGLLSSVEDVVGTSCVLATNTSSLSIDAIAAGLRDPSRLVGMHFFNPAPAMRLVEVSPACAPPLQPRTSSRRPPQAGARPRFAAPPHRDSSSTGWRGRSTPRRSP